MEIGSATTAPELWRQVNWDATSYRMFLECPRKYQLSMIEGWRPQEDAIDLAFGSWVHLGIETFYRTVIEEKADFDTAQLKAVGAVIAASWYDGDDYQGPMFGEYANAWRCLGLTKYRNEKGNPAKCPFSHAGKLFGGDRPERCSCGSPTGGKLTWVPVNKTKDRYNAVRAVCWYTEEHKDSVFEPVSVRMAGKDHALLEVNAKLEAGDINLVSNFDNVKAFGDELWIVDYKTTGLGLSKMFFDKFQPNVQTDWYGSFGPKMKVGDVGQLPGIQGVIIEGIQLIQSGARFGSQVFRMSDARRAEFIGEMKYWLYQYDMLMREGPETEWPRNRASCYMCAFKSVCAAEPDKRAGVLAESFVRARWNPETRRVEAIDVADSEGVDGPDAASD